MGKAARRKEARRLERALLSQSANDTQTVPAMQQPLIVSYNKLRHAISWADLSTATVEKVAVETVPIQPAANDTVIEAPTAPAVKHRRKPGPKPKPLAPEVRQAQLWALYADLWDEMEEGMSSKERRALQRALARNSGTLDDLIEDDTAEAKESRRVVPLVDEDDEYQEEEVEYADFFEDWNPDY
ncbi:hypothetical protein [Pseudomonas sp. MS15a(2019)]|uniref:hypothetical protein n=1 Tax=Pseudomonas sp. MS15a(2019) TaxID=2579938 RepID=UPI0015636BD5|nr:hypothetical protein [Pseudomonas sp. MS15a(2019)]NRH40638.1 hypothetical protein [Pseudomonas sp. MS15a(2019)]